MFLFSCPENTRIKQISEAIVNAIGVKMHANLPSLPMVGGGCAVCCFLWWKCQGSSFRGLGVLRQRRRQGSSNDRE